MSDEDFNMEDNNEQIEENQIIEDMSDEDIISNMKDIEFFANLTQWEEWRNDPVKWAEDCVMVPAAGGSELVKLYEPQKRVLRSFYKDHFIIMNKTRQVGGSFLMKIAAAHISIFYENVNVGVLSRTGNEASQFTKDVKAIIRDIPYSWAKPEKFIDDNKRYFTLPNGSGVFTDSVSLQNPTSVFRGRSITVLIIDECAFIPKIDIAYTAVAPTLNKTQLVAKEAGIPYGIVLISTPNKTSGIGYWYYKRWMDAISAEDSVWVPHKIHWKEIPDFVNDPTWYKRQCDILENNAQKIAQELNLEFIGSEGAIFDADVQRALNEISTIFPPTKSISMDSGRLWIFEEISHNKFYIVGVDTASASGQDYSAIQVIEYRSCRQVMEFKGKLEPKLFAAVLKKIIMMLPKYIVVIENSGGYGLTVLNELQFDEEKEYNIYGENRGEGDVKKFIPGLSTNLKTRPLILEAMYNMVVDDPTCIKSDRLSMELLGLVNKNGKIQADAGFHDDLVMAYAFACYVRKYGLDKYAGFLQGEVEDAETIKKEDDEQERFTLSITGKRNKVSLVEELVLGGNKQYQSPEDIYMDEIKKEIQLKRAAIFEDEPYKDRNRKDKSRSNNKTIYDDEELENEMFSSGLFD